MVAVNSTPVGRDRGRPVQRVVGRRKDRRTRRNFFPLAMGAASARPLLNSFYPDDDFRRGVQVNLPVVVFALLALFCLVMVMWSLRQ